MTEFHIGKDYFIYNKTLGEVSILRIIDTWTSRRLSAVGSTPTSLVANYFVKMASGSSADTAWTFDGGVAMPAVEDSTADDVAVQSVDDITTEEEKKVKKPSTAPKARAASRASTPTRSSSTGSKLPKARDRNERAGLLVLQSVGHEAMLKDKRTKSPGTISKPGSSRSSSSRRSRRPSRVRDRSVVSAGNRDRNGQQMDAVAAIEDISPIVNESPTGDRSGMTLAQVRDQMESSRFAQQMYHHSEMQRQETIIKALMEKIAELQKEDEGSTMRIQELERQRDTAHQAMEHMNQVNQAMQSNYNDALRVMDEQARIARRQDEQVAEHLQSELHVLRSEAATSVVELEEQAQGDKFVMAKSTKSSLMNYMSKLR